MHRLHDYTLTLMLPDRLSLKETTILLNYLCVHVCVFLSCFLPYCLCLCMCSSGSAFKNPQINISVALCLTLRGIAQTFLYITTKKDDEKRKLTQKIHVTHRAALLEKFLF